MAKFFGAIGFVETKETKPGVYKEIATEKNYYGDVIKSTQRFESSGNLNDNINVTNQISIIADPFAHNKIHAMRYVNWMGVSWKITNIAIQSPRVILTIGGIYNG